MKVGLATIGRYASALQGALFTNVGKVINKFRQFIASFFKARNSVDALPRTAVVLHSADSAHKAFAQKLTATAGSQTNATQTPPANVTTVATQTEDTVEATINSQPVVDDDDLSNQFVWDDSDLSNQLVRDDDDDLLCQSVVNTLDRLSTMIGTDIKKAEQQDAQARLNLSTQAKQAQSDIDNRADILERQIQDTYKQLSNSYQETDKALAAITQKIRNDAADVDQLLNEMEKE